MKHLIRLALASAFGPPTAPLPPPDAEAVCGPLRSGDDDILVWALRDEPRGLHYFLGRFDARHGHPRAAPIAVGWGYDGNGVCVAAARASRIAIVFPFVDPYGGTPTLAITIVEGERIVAKHDFAKRLGCFDIAPVAVRGTHAGWIVDFRCADDAPVEQVRLDHEGRPVYDRPRCRG